ncbi:DNA-binding protein [Dysgonomonas sp. 521]|uniref:helix-turn-helix domain-containing protein n=1 Tax=Dysgonomonas sp. 521 TaxID=2302932 RepID=UPI0013D09585|nr:helix-turn-helix domain-containing protein [Dysgonomonas sp. 521]NDV96437.1 DNA-binding protein [Dysgonomonas sp. 521]
MNLNDILDNNSPEIRDIFSAIEKAGENISFHIREQKPSLSGELFLDNREACKLLRLSSRTLQDYRDRGLVAFYKLEGKILYKLSDIRKMLEQNYFDAWDKSRSSIQ